MSQMYSLSCQSSLQGLILSPGFLLGIQGLLHHCLLPLNPPLVGTLPGFLGLSPQGSCSAHTPAPAGSCPRESNKPEDPLATHASAALLSAQWPLQIHPELALSYWTLKTSEDDSNKVASKGQVRVAHCSDFSWLLKLFILVHSGGVWLVLVSLLEVSVAREEDAAQGDQLTHFSILFQTPQSRGQVSYLSHRTHLHRYLTLQEQILLLF